MDRPDTPSPLTPALSALGRGSCALPVSTSCAVPENQGFESRGVDRVGAEVALVEGAAFAGEEAELFFGFDAFGYDFETQ